MYQTHDIGSLVKHVVGTAPAASAAGAINGAAIDRKDYGSCVLLCTTGAETGSPSARSATAKLQDSDDGSTGWADLTGASVAVSVVSSSGSVKVNLAGAKRYIRVVQTIAFSGGTSPSLANATAVVLGGPTAIPAP